MRLRSSPLGVSVRQGQLGHFIRCPDSVCGPFRGCNARTEVGSIHTHTYRRGVTVFEEVQSLGDLATWDTLDRVTGIAKNGKRKCSAPVFHGPPNPVEVTVK